MRAWPGPSSRSSWLLVALLAGSVFVFQLSGQQASPPGRVRPQAPEDITVATATGPAAEVLALEQKIEEATVRGDTVFAETVLSNDFHFRHGDGWTRGEKTGGIEDDRAAYLKRIADKEYLVHDLDGTRIEMHGDLAITWGRYVSLFMPKNRNPASPGRLTTIWYERIWAKRDGRWQWLSHRTVWGPHDSPAGVDPTQVSAAQAVSYVPGLPAANARPEDHTPETKEAAQILALEQQLGAAVPAGDVALFDRHTSDDFLMWHGDVWTRGGRSPLIDTKQAFAERVRNTQYLEWHFDSARAEMHGDVAVTYGRYAATLRGSHPDRAWFSVWYERVYQKRNDRWMFLSQRTVHGASYGPTRESVSDK
jgi:ketosteroid isomerase-like protein